MWVVFVVVLEPPVDLIERGAGVGPRPDADIVAFESLRLGFSFAFVLRALHPR